MININIVCVGNLKEKFWKDASSEYEKRLSKFCKLKIIEIEEQNRFLEIDKIKEAEGLKILEHLEGECFLLDLNGKEYSSEEFADRLEKISLSSSLITFVIGGSYGVSDKVKNMIKNKIAFGRVTYPHNLARIILLEQIYRVFMINSGAKYHK